MTYRTLLIGKNLEVIFSTNPTDLHCRGTVVDETQNMIQIENGKLKWLIKKNVVVLLDGRMVDGRELVGRPENRIKR